MHNLKRNVRGLGGPAHWQGGWQSSLRGRSDAADSARASELGGGVLPRVAAQRREHAAAQSRGRHCAAAQRRGHAATLEKRSLPVRGACQ